MLKAPYNRVSGRWFEQAANEQKAVYQQMGDRHKEAPVADSAKAVLEGFRVRGLGFMARLGFFFRAAFHSRIMLKVQ